VSEVFKDKGWDISMINKPSSARPLNIVIQEIVNVLSVERYTVLILVLAFTILQVLSIIISPKIYDADKISSVISNIAVDFVGGMMTFIILDRSIKHLSPIGEHDSFPTTDFIKNIKNTAKGEIKILDTWSYLFNETESREEFYPAVRDALRKHTKIHILLIDPNSDAAKQRDEELRKNTSIKVVDEIVQCLSYALQLQNSVRTEISADSHLLEVRIYDANPSITFHAYNNISYISFFPITDRADKSSHLEVPLTTSLGKLANKRFMELWNNSIPIDVYLAYPKNNNVAKQVSHFLYDPLNLN
jgi:hypothetical protein